MALFSKVEEDPTVKIGMMAQKSDDPYFQAGALLGAALGGAFNLFPQERDRDMEIQFMREFSAGLDPEDRASWLDLSRKAADYGLSNLSASLLEQGISLKESKKKKPSHKFVPEFNLDSEVRLLESEAKQMGISLEKYKQRDPAYSSLQDSANQALNDALAEASEMDEGGAYVQRRYQELKKQYRQNILSGMQEPTVGSNAVTIEGKSYEVIGKQDGKTVVRDPVTGQSFYWEQ